jgi:hypothetical protein
VGGEERDGSVPEHGSGDRAFVFQRLGVGEPEWLGRASVGASGRTGVAHLRVRPSSSIGRMVSP